MTLLRRLRIHLTSRWPRRLAALALLVLQGGIAAAPLLEARGERTMRVHIEETGARHIDMHSEAACALCAARSMHAVASAPPKPELELAPRMAVERIRVDAPVNATSERALRSRAPPVVG